MLGKANFIVLENIEVNISLAGSAPMTVIAIPFQERKYLRLVFLGTSQMGAKPDDYDSSDPDLVPIRIYHLLRIQFRIAQKGKSYPIGALHESPKRKKAALSDGLTSSQSKKIDRYG
jgi:hypothetical protein